MLLIFLKTLWYNLILYYKAHSKLFKTWNLLNSYMFGCNVQQCKTSKMYCTSQLQYILQSNKIFNVISACNTWRFLISSCITSATGLILQQQHKQVIIKAMLALLYASTYYWWNFVAILMASIDRLQFGQHLLNGKIATTLGTV